MIGSIAGLTDVGESRDHNEDGFMILDLTSGQELPDSTSNLLLEGNPLILAVSDGMGGAQAGEIASAVTLQVLRKATTEAGKGIAEVSTEAVKSWLADVIQKANRTVKEAGEGDAEVRGMGATITAAAVFADKIVVAHVGDSRAYVLRDGGLTQITVDHTFVGQMVARGHLTPEEARIHDHRHLLLQAVGAKDVLNIDTLSREMEAGDRLLLCSDGLHDLVDDARIAEIISSEERPDAQCRALVDAALSEGGFDNITVIVLQAS